MKSGVAIVTGAGSGIGGATALELSCAGYSLALAGRTRETLDRTAPLLSGESFVVTGDVSRPEDAQRIVKASLAHFGRIDALVNNAGYAPMLSMEQMTIDQWRKIIDTNLSAAFYMTQAAWETMVKQKSGVVVNISSEAARNPFAGLGAYGAAKAGLNMLGMALAREGQALGIRVHTVAPGAVETGMLRSIVSSEQYPTGQVLAPQDVARVVVQCIAGDLRYSAGEVIWVHKTS